MTAAPHKSATGTLGCSEFAAAGLAGVSISTGHNREKALDGLPEGWLPWRLVCREIVNDRATGRVMGMGWLPA
jgi:hypothetical protein